MLGDFERDRLGKTGDTVLGGDVSGFERRRHQRMRRGDVDDPAPRTLLHGRDCQPRGVEGAGEIDRQNRIPFLDRKIFDRRDMLDTGVVDDDVDTAEFVFGQSDHRFYFARDRHIGRVVQYLDLVLVRDVPADGFDLSRIAEAVKHDIRAAGGKPARDTKPDPAGGSCDDGGLSGQHADNRSELLKSTLHP